MYDPDTVRDKARKIRDVEKTREYIKSSLDDPGDEFSGLIARKIGYDRFPVPEEFPEWIKEAANRYLNEVTSEKDSKTKLTTSAPRSVSSPGTTEPSPEERDAFEEVKENSVGREIGVIMENKRRRY